MINIVTESDEVFERSAALYASLPMPRPLPPGDYTPEDIEAVASLYTASYINLLQRKHENAQKKIKGRVKGAPRRTRQNMRGLRVLIYHLAETEKPVTIRQTFYALVNRYQAIAKLESEYDAVDRIMIDMRREEVLPFPWVADSTRWVRRPNTYEGLEHALRNTARTYRRTLWAHSPVYVEIWCEKEALAGVLVEVTDAYDVPLMVARGYSSDSYLYGAAENIRAIGKPAYIYLLGDHDPDGQDALRCTREKLTKFVRGKVPVHCEILAVTPKQITEWNLPTRPAKKGNSKAKKFKGPWVDLDAIPSPQLRDLAREAIERHIDPYQLANIQAIEEKERATLDYIVSVLPYIREGAA